MSEQWEGEKTPAKLDELATYRTLLANERTMLSYIRLAIALVIAGLTIFHFSEQHWFSVLGLACTPAGILTAWVGITRFRAMNRVILVSRQEIPSVIPSNVGQAELARYWII